jgi:glycosyltransferase involved in cell wall biosynthesis
LYNLLAALDLEASVIAFNSGGYWADPIRELGREVIELERQGRMETRRLWQVTNLIRKRQPDIVHVFLDGISGMYGRLGALLAGHSCVIVGQRSHPTYYPGWYQRLMPWLNQDVSMLVFNSYTARDYMVAHHMIPARKTDVIPNGIEVERFQQGRETWPWPHDWRGKTIVGTVSHMTVPKSPETFIQMADCAHQQNLDLRFALIGAGPRYQEMQHYAESLGVQDILWMPGERQDVPNLLNHMDIFALTSRSEGMPNAILEAMAAGLPCVVTDAGDSRKATRHQETGYVVPVGDVEALSRHVIELASQPDLRRVMGQRGQAMIRQNFDFHAMVLRYQDLYRRLYAT